MEVVVLLVAIVGVALLVIPRVQRRTAGSRRSSKPRKRVSTPVVAAAAVPASSATAWAPPESAGPEWEDDLGWEGESEPAPEAEVRELPSIERWRARASDDDWIEDDDDGLGWEGEDEPPPAPELWNG